MKAYARPAPGVPAVNTFPWYWIGFAPVPPMLSVAPAAVFVLLNLTTAHAPGFRMNPGSAAVFEP